MPTNLAPSLDDIPQDRPLTTDNGCHVDLLGTENQPCEFGDPDGEQTMVLFGDSHAQQWFPAFDLAAERNGWRLISWTKGACPVADLLPHSDNLERSYPECVTWRDDTIEQIIGVRPDLVVVAQSGEPDEREDGEITDQTWTEATVATVGRLQAAAIPVTYLMDTPYPGFEVPDCVADHLDDLTECIAARDAVTTHPGRRELLRADLHAADVETIDPTEWFCTETGCPPIVGNLLVYRDTDHMTATYSEWLAAVVEPLVPSGDGR